MNRAPVLSAAFAAFAAFVAFAPAAFADDPVDGSRPPPARPLDGAIDRPAAPAPVAGAAVRRDLVFGDGIARFRVERDATAGRMTFRLADPAMRLDAAPVVVVNDASGPRDVQLVAVPGQAGTWTWTDAAVRGERFDGNVRVHVAGRAYSAPLQEVWVTEPAVAGGARVEIRARHGGRVLPLTDCGASVEVVQDPATGTLTIYSFDDVVVTEAPVITVTETSGPATVTLTRVEGSDGVWLARHEAFKRTTTSAKIRLLVNGKPCEAPLVYGPAHGGQTVTFAGGPTFEVVREREGGAYTFYAVDETFDGKPYTVEKPAVAMNGRTYELTRVEGEPRAWRLIGLDTKGSDARDGQLNITLFGKTLSTKLGLSGLGLDVK